MKKVFRKICALLLLGTVAFASACAGAGGGTFIEDKDYDPDKLNITVDVYYGGYGVKWIEEAAKRFNAKSDSVYVTALSEKLDPNGIASDITTGGSDSVSLYLASADWASGIYKDCFVDLSDVLQMKPDGESGKTIEQKMKTDKGVWQKISSKYGQGLYSIPYLFSLLNLVFDYDTFVENNWLSFADANDAAAKSALAAQGITYTAEGNKLKFVSSTESTLFVEGDYILTAGNDGKYGTYDDGQPQTLAEFDEMLGKIQAKGVAPFIWSGQNASYYVESLFNSVFAQYAGVDTYKTFFSYNSDGKAVKLTDGSQKVITPDNGYEVFNMDGLDDTVNFAKKYFANPAYRHDACNDTLCSHIDAQSYYLLGYNGSANDQESAFLVEGSWWENEAKGSFRMVEKDGRGYGQRRYRYLVMPTFDGQQNDKPVVNGAVSCSWVINKNVSKEKQQAAKEFLAYMCSDEILRLFTTQTGEMLTYDYTLSDSEYDGLTHFAKCVYQMSNDPQHVDVLGHELMRNTSPINFATSKSKNNFVGRVNDITYYSLYASLGRNSAEEIFASIRDYYSPSTWASYCEEARDQGFIL